MSDPRHLPHGAAADGVDAVVITPATAGWTYSGLRVIELGPGQSRTLSTGHTEVAVLPLAGSCTVQCEGHRFDLRGRRDVFSGVSDFAYLPIGTRFALASDDGGRFALASAEATRRLEPAYGAAENVPVEIRGAGRATRQLNNFLAPEAFPADKLVALEVLTPAGNWSSYPPHKHDELRDGEAILEEIYYFEVAARDPDGSHRLGEGFAFHRLYTGHGDIDLCPQVAQGDVVVIPRGYHGPTMTAPGYDLYYLCVLAGPGAERTTACLDDPAHGWVRQGWSTEAPDSRLPLVIA
jgi:5-deoxy-glucuronate isomerase